MNSEGVFLSPGRDEPGQAIKSRQRAQNVVQLFTGTLDYKRGSLVVVL